MAEAFRAALLLSMPQLQDPNFARTVVLLCDYGPDGAFGLVLNRPTDMPATSMVRLEPPVAAATTCALWIGGPVEPERGWILLGGRAARDRVQDRSATACILSTSPTLLREVLEARPAPRARVHRGLCGLGTGTARRGARALVVADGRRGSRSRLRRDPLDRMWETAIRRLGADPSMLTTSHGVH